MQAVADRLLALGTGIWGLEHCSAGSARRSCSTVYAGGARPFSPVMTVAVRRSAGAARLQATALLPDLRLLLAPMRSGWLGSDCEEDGLPGNALCCGSTGTLPARELGIRQVQLAENDNGNPVKQRDLLRNMK